jgi:hypothetical protein
MNQQQFDRDLCDPDAWRESEEWKNNPLRRLFDNPIHSSHRQFLPHNADITDPYNEAHLRSRRPRR